MADTREIVIRIVDDTTKDYELSSKDSKVDNKQAIAKVSGTASKTMKDFAWKTFSIKFARDLGRDLFDIGKYYLTRPYRISDDYIGEVNTQNILNVATRVSGYALTVASFTKIGSLGGPIGAVVGASVGTIAVASDIIWKEIKFHDNLLIQRTTYNQNLNFTQERAGVLNFGRQTLN